ncbi:hypothetical protein HMPREF1210_01388 [Paenisporosarcina sp. HGH0030]|uniref:thermonuclease family protein n=1 Tax=Paenisporosarcina sp. HGH0030 TaxID=1078085 RepID=UPI00034E27C3|nr:thermonuclease family protein [Paenisporosarcina sp. HGH0030]EPD52036.1 hypothetical protein HMPREF1210_01388 [Paenisporosarcina sp. HGH0030]
MKKWLWLLLVPVLFAGCDVSSNFTDKSTSANDTIPVELIAVIDGDTIKVKYNGKIETVRYLLIDTPEVRHQTLGNQPFGDEASERNEQLLKNVAVSLKFDEGDRYDDYERLLAYVYADGQSVQETLLSEGLARVAYVFPPNDRYVDAYKEAEAIARKNNLGVWEYKNYVTKRGFDETKVEEEKTEVNKHPSECLIKGNINRENKKIYHTPTGKYYNQTKPEKWFCSEQQALDAGFKKSGE